MAESGGYTKKLPCVQPASFQEHMGKREPGKALARGAQVKSSNIKESKKIALLAQRDQNEAFFLLE